MSSVTTIMVCCPLIEEISDILPKINKWLVEDKEGGMGVGLTPIQHYFTGNKYPQASVWGGSFNYFPLDGFIEMLKTLNWRSIGHVQIFIKKEHDCMFSVYSLKDGLVFDKHFVEDY